MPIKRTARSSLGAGTIAVVFAASLPFQAPAEGEIKMPPRQLLLEKGVQLPSGDFKTSVVRVILPKGYKTPLHAHDGPGPRYVVKGNIKFEEGGESRVYRPGEVFWESGQWMTVENVGEDEAEMIVFELTPPK
jgi:quercetin dioxygenase-like cupin family protein